MTIIADIEFGTKCQSPKPVEIQTWATAALTPLYPDADTELCIRVVSEAEMIELNHSFREKEKSTNVLSFPANIPEQPQLNILGDIAICAAVVEREALEQLKELSAHWAHMVVHGCLHLAGYDHIDETEALEMETLEINILAELGYPNPYQTHSEFTNHLSATNH